MLLDSIWIPFTGNIRQCKLMSRDQRADQRWLRDRRAGRAQREGHEGLLEVVAILA